MLSNYLWWPFLCSTFHKSLLAAKFGFFSRFCCFLSHNKTEQSLNELKINSTVFDWKSFNLVKWGIFCKKSPFFNPKPELGKIWHAWLRNMPEYSLSFSLSCICGYIIWSPFLNIAFQKKQFESSTKKNLQSCFFFQSKSKNWFVNQSNIILGFIWCTNYISKANICKYLKFPKNHWLIISRFFCGKMIIGIELTFVVDTFILPVFHEKYECWNCIVDNLVFLTPKVIV